MVKKLLISALFGLFLLPQTVLASDFGCRVLLCMANPAGPMAEPACRPTIEELYRQLYNRKPFPSCNYSNASNSSMSINQGHEAYYPCNKGYDQVMVEEEDNSQTPVCRKLIGYHEEVDEENVLIKTPMYDQYTMMRRQDPHWVKVTTITPQGALEGQKFWYRIEKKKKGIF